MERTALWLTIAALIIAIFILATHQATLEEELSHPRVVTTSTTTTTTPTNPLAADLLGLKQQVDELQANRGLTGPEVRELVETLLPAPNNPPTDEACSEPPCTSVTTTARAVVPRVTAPRVVPTSPSTTEKRRRRR